MPTAVERGVGVKAIIAVLQQADEEGIIDRAPTDVGKEFGGTIFEFNFAMIALPTDDHLGGLLLPAVQHETDLLGMHPDFALF
jgi:hypothetical protein